MKKNLKTSWKKSYGDEFKYSYITIDNELFPHNSEIFRKCNECKNCSNN